MSGISEGLRNGTQSRFRVKAWRHGKQPGIFLALVGEVVANGKVEISIPVLSEN
jgi:hypothetical protein